MGFGGCVVIRVSSPISIGECMKGEWIVGSKEDPMCCGANQIPKNSLCGLPMVFRWTVNKLGQVVDCEGDVGPRERKVLEAAHQLKILCRIGERGTRIEGQFWR